MKAVLASIVALASLSASTAIAQGKLVLKNNGAYVLGYHSFEQNSNGDITNINYHNDLAAGQSTYFTSNNFKYIETGPNVAGYGYQRVNVPESGTTTLTWNGTIFNPSGDFSYEAPAPVRDPGYNPYNSSNTIINNGGFVVNVVGEGITKDLTVGIGATFYGDVEVQIGCIGHGHISHPVELSFEKHHYLEFSGTCFDPTIKEYDAGKPQVKEKGKTVNAEHNKPYGSGNYKK